MPVALLMTIVGSSTWCLLYIPLAAAHVYYVLYRDFFRNIAEHLK